MDLTHFQFDDVALAEACWLDGKPYFTGQAIGEWLEYKEPRKAVNKIVERNPHINNPRWSVGVKLTSTDGKNYDIRVYDPIGLQLIVFESRQPKAVAYKVAVAHLVWAFMNGEIKPSRWSQRGDLVAAARQILSLPCSHRRGALVRDLAEREGCSVSTAYRRIGRVTGLRMRAAVRADAGTTRSIQ